LLEHRVRQHLAGAVPAGRAQVVRGLLDRQAVGRGDEVQDLEPFGDDLGTDAVTGDDGQADATGNHGLTLSSRSHLTKRDLTSRDRAAYGGPAPPPGTARAARRRPGLRARPEPATSFI